MTKQEFDNYKFSIHTQINYFEDVWDDVKEVNFFDRWVEVKRGQIVYFNEIKNIRQLGLK